MIILTQNITPNIANGMRGDLKILLYKNPRVKWVMYCKNNIVNAKPISPYNQPKIFTRAAPIKGHCITDNVVYPDL